MFKALELNELAAGRIVIAMGKRWVGNHRPDGSYKGSVCKILGTYGPMVSFKILQDEFGRPTWEGDRVLTLDIRDGWDWAAAEGDYLQSRGITMDDIL